MLLKVTTMHTQQLRIIIWTRKLSSCCTYASSLRHFQTQPQTKTLNSIDMHLLVARSTKIQLKEQIRMCYICSTSSRTIKQQTVLEPKLRNRRCHLYAERVPVKIHFICGSPIKASPSRWLLGRYVKIYDWRPDIVKCEWENKRDNHCGHSSRCRQYIKKCEKYQDMAR